jgi:hypothetical protein
MVANCLLRYCLFMLISKANLLPKNNFASHEDAPRHYSACLWYYERMWVIALSPEAAASRISEHIDARRHYEQGTDGQWGLIRSLLLARCGLIYLYKLHQVVKRSRNNQFGPDLATLVWSLICHCGFEKNELWPEERPSFTHLSKKEATLVQHILILDALPSSFILSVRYVQIKSNKCDGAKHGN